MRPAHQRLGGHCAAAANIDLRLKFQDELVALQRQHQIAFQVGPVGCLQRQFRTIHFRTAAPLMLGMIHGDIGRAQQSRQRLAMVGVAGDADRRAQVDMLTAEVKPFAQRELDRAGNARGGAMAGQVGEEHGELVTRQPPDHGIARPSSDLRHHHFAQPPGDPRQQLVARGMAQRIIDALEPVQIDEEQSGLALFHPLGEMAFDLTAKAGAIGKAGNLVEQRERLDMVQIGPHLAEQAFHRHGKIGHFARDIARHRRLQVAMRGRHEPLGRHVDGGGGGRDRLARRSPAHRSA